MEIWPFRIVRWAGLSPRSVNRATFSFGLLCGMPWMLAHPKRVPSPPARPSAQSVLHEQTANIAALAPVTALRLDVSLQYFMQLAACDACVSLRKW